MKPRCPTCKKPLPEGLETPTFPFCNPRCKLADLGSWLSGQYVVAGDAPAAEGALSDADILALLHEGS